MLLVQDVATALGRWLVGSAVRDLLMSAMKPDLEHIKPQRVWKETELMLSSLTGLVVLLVERLDAIVNSYQT